jgi:hypothetical protein
MYKRDIYTGELCTNVCKKPTVKTPMFLDKEGRPAYLRYTPSTMTVINPEDKVVVSIRGYHDDEARKRGIKNHVPYIRQSHMEALHPELGNHKKRGKASKGRGSAKKRTAGHRKKRGRCR